MRIPHSTNGGPHFASHVPSKNKAQRAMPACYSATVKVELSLQRRTAGGSLELPENRKSGLGRRRQYVTFDGNSSFKTSSVSQNGRGPL